MTCLLPYVKLQAGSSMNLWSFKQRIVNGPLARYAKLRVTHAPGMPGTFSRPPLVSDPDMHHGTCVTHVPWCMRGSLNSGFLWSRWRGKRSRHSRRIRNPQFYVSGKRPMQHWMPQTRIHLIEHERTDFHWKKCTLQFFFNSFHQTIDWAHKKETTRPCITDPSFKGITLPELCTVEKYGRKISRWQFFSWKCFHMNDSAFYHTIWSTFWENQERCSRMTEGYFAQGIGNKNRGLCDMHHVYSLPWLWDGFLDPQKRATFFWTVKDTVPASALDLQVWHPCGLPSSSWSYLLFFSLPPHRDKPAYNSDLPCPSWHSKTSAPPQRIPSKYP